MAVDFRTLLSKPMDDVAKPPLWPAGTYYGITKQYEFGEARNDKKTPYVRFFYQVTGPGPDIDPDTLVDLKGKPIDLTKRQFRKEFYLTPDAEWRLKDYIAGCGVSTSGRNFGETIPDCLNAPVVLNVIHQNGGDDGTEIFATLDSVKGAPQT